MENPMPDPISKFHKRKQERKEHFDKYVFQWKQKPCGGCAGSGHYDSHNSPKCSSCDGTGKEMVPREEYLEYIKNSHICPHNFDQRMNFPKENCGWCKAFSEKKSKSI